LKQMPKMPLAKYDDMIEAFSSDRTDQPFTITVLRWRSWRGWAIWNAHCPETPDEDVTVDTIPIANEIAWPQFPAINLHQLPTYPFGAWMHSCSKP